MSEGLILAVITAMRKEVCRAMGWEQNSLAESPSMLKQERALAEVTIDAVRTYSMAASTGTERLLRAIACGTEAKTNKQDIIFDSAADIIAAQRDAIAQLETDAEKWRTLTGCARFRMMGAAGFGDGSNPADANGYRHLGIELWTIHDQTQEQNAPDRERALKFLDDFLAQARAVRMT
jgi:hypothetical protein